LHSYHVGPPTASRWVGQDKVITKMKKNKTISPSMIHTTRVLVLECPDLTTRMPRGFDASAYPRDRTEPSRNPVKMGAATITKPAKNCNSRGRVAIPW
jgi:hypothetical protein